MFLNSIKIILAITKRILNEGQGGREGESFIPHSIKRVDNSTLKISNVGMTCLAKITPYQIISRSVKMTQSLNENMRIKQVVETYPISKATVWRFVKQGKFNAYRVTDGVTIFKRSELEEFFSGGAK